MSSHWLEDVLGNVLLAARRDDAIAYRLLGKTLEGYAYCCGAFVMGAPAHWRDGLWSGGSTGQGLGKEP